MSASMRLVRPVTLPNDVQTRTTAFPVAMSNYEFAVYRQPPALGADTDDVFAEWLDGDGIASSSRSPEPTPT